MFMFKRSKTGWLFRRFMISHPAHLARTMVLVLFLTAIEIASISGQLIDGVQAASINHPIITEVYYDTYLAYEPEEFIRINNPTDLAVQLDNWAISNGTYQIRFPSGTSLAPGASLYVTKKATAFQQEMAQKANFEYGADTDPAVPQMVVSGSVPTFSNTGGQVLLKDALGNLVDAVIYGTVTYIGPGWAGPTIPGVSEGVILERDRDEITSEYQDSDTGADWDDLRVYTAGQSHWPYPPFTFTGNVTAYASPDSSFQVLANLVDSALASIDLNIYEFHNLYLMDKILNAIQRGVKVRIFVEGNPVGGLSDEQRYVSQQIVKAGGQVRYIITDDANDIHDRYTFDHAKYAIIDGKKVFVESENWKNTGVPVDPSTGNRGWGVIVDNIDLAGFFTQVFEDDWNPAFRDSYPYTIGTAYGEPASTFIPDRTVPTGAYISPFAPANFTDTFTVSPVLAPDSALLTTKSILGLMKNARKTLYIEQLYIHKYWGATSTGSTTSTPDIYLEEAINAARRGVKVRILLDAATVDLTDPRNNVETAKYVNDIAAAEHLDMQAKLINLDVAKVEKIHNKGMIVDGQTVLVSSINWSENSPTNNREAGLIITNPQLADYYNDIFWYDWYDGNPVDHAVISEVYYDTAGVDADEEYIEVYNPTAAALNLAGWKLKDNGGEWVFPDGTTLAPQTAMVVARNSAGFYSLFKRYPDISGLTLSLSNTGDYLHLLDATGAEIDRVAWENAKLNWDIFANTGSIIERVPAYRDTNSRLDWLNNQAPGPGTAR